MAVWAPVVPLRMSLSDSVLSPIEGWSHYTETGYASVYILYSMMELIKEMFSFSFHIFYNAFLDAHQFIKDPPYRFWHVSVPNQELKEANPLTCSDHLIGLWM